MKLNLEQIKAVACGAARVWETDTGVRLNRFTAKQFEIYRGNPRADATANIELLFWTDAPEMFLSVFVSSGSTRTFCSVDVAVNDTYIGCLTNCEDMAKVVGNSAKPFDLGLFSKTFSLGNGKKTVRITLPSLQSAEIREVSLPGATYLIPAKPQKQMIAFGDSITQGYDALHPSGTYVSLLGRKLDAEVFNKAIGGEMYLPALAERKDDFTPDYVTVAYGTNDWSTRSRPVAEENMMKFFAAVQKNYPDSKIFALAPIWRKDMNQTRAFGAFLDMHELIKETCAQFKITYIDCFDFVPKDEKYFTDLRLHPNDNGFVFYAEALYKEMKKYI